jgi:hypothetical protein
MDKQRRRRASLAIVKSLLGIPILHSDDVDATACREGSSGGAVDRSSTLSSLQQLGAVRSLRDFEESVGIDLSEGSVMDDAKRGARISGAGGAALAYAEDEWHTVLGAIAGQTRGVGGGGFVSVMATQDSSTTSLAALNLVQQFLCNSQM